ncbi:MAG: ATP-binding protein, partial [Archangium sp.]
MNEPPVARHNPYVGPRAFRQGEPIFGRDREAQQLLELLIADRIVLLHSPSGAGKTSLIVAALLPRLKDEGFQPLPLIRVNLNPSLALPREKPHNRFVLSMLLCLEEGLPPEQRTPVAELAEMRLRDWFEKHEGALASGGAPVLIIDQFEELLTLEPPNRAAKAGFLREVGELLRSHERWALFAIREDYLGALEPYARMLPTRLKSTFRLDLLGEKAARLAIQQPAELQGVTFTDEATGKLADDLRRVRVPKPDGTTEEQLGPYVEPVQLQVVCQELWERLPPADTSIDPEDVEAVGNTDETLARYYAARVGAVAAEKHVPERALREWFEKRLILQGGLRGQVLKEQRESGGLGNEVIDALVSTHLVRAESWGNRCWFELAHDRLIKPVQRDNTAWFERHLNPLQRQARWWSEKGKIGALLLRDEVLEDMERWAEAHPEELDPLEREFLERSREARALAKR